MVAATVEIAATRHGPGSSGRAFGNPFAMVIWNRVPMLLRFQGSTTRLKHSQIRDYGQIGLLPDLRTPRATGASAVTRICARWVSRSAFRTMVENRQGPPNHCQQRSTGRGSPRLAGDRRLDTHRRHADQPCADSASRCDDDIGGQAIYHRNADDRRRFLLAP